MIVSMVKINGALRVLDADKPLLEGWKQKISEGQVIQANFSEEAANASQKARKYFHLIRDAYARAMGYDREYAKDELCIGFGVAELLENILEEPPRWSGHVRQIWGRTYVRKSITEYTSDEIAGLIDGAIQACAENGIDIRQLVDDYRQEVRNAGEAT